jgi:MSHA biogenesis protein MshO
MIVAIAITGIVASVVAVFIKRPVEGYVDAARRAELTDIADIALRRMTRDIRTALPNSIRVRESGGVHYLEYLQTTGGGRYRAEPDGGGGGDPLDFTATDSSFDVIGTGPVFTGRHVVIYNLSADEPDPPCAGGAASTANNAYVGDNRALGNGSVSAVTLGAPFQFPLASPGRRFHVVEYAVTYACNPATGELRRHWNYGINQCQSPLPPAGGSSALLASSVTSCSFSYTTGGATGRMGVVALTLQIEQAGEKVRLFQQAHVSNVP